MKKFFQLALVALLFVAATTTASAQKFAYVNSAEILSVMPAMKQAESNLEAFQKQLQKQLQADVERFQTDARAFQELVAKGELAPKDQETRAAALQKREQEILAAEQNMVQQLQEKRTQLLEPIYSDINEAIANVAKEQGFTFIFDQQVLLYGQESQNVSAAVKTKLGI